MMDLSERPEPENPGEAAPSVAPEGASSGSASPIPISELVREPDFPQNAIGKQVDIAGITGVISEVVRSSIRVRTEEGGTMSYNCNVLRKLYGPRVIAEDPPSMMDTPSAPAEPAEPVKPKREFIADPNFQTPLRPIEEFVSREDFPRCAFGEHLDLHGYSGVVVEIVGKSLKIRSEQGATRSYNADGLRKLYSKARPDSFRVSPPESDSPST